MPKFGVVTGVMIISCGPLSITIMSGGTVDVSDPRSREIL